jgi:hypothetical protein
MIYVVEIAGGNKPKWQPPPVNTVALTTRHHPPTRHVLLSLARNAEPSSLSDVKLPDPPVSSLRGIFPGEVKGLDSDQASIARAAEITRAVKNAVDEADTNKAKDVDLA